MAKSKKASKEEAPVELTVDQKITALEENMRGIENFLANQSQSVLAIDAAAILAVMSLADLGSISHPKSMTDPKVKQAQEAIKKMLEIIQQDLPKKQDEQSNDNE